MSNNSIVENAGAFYMTLFTIVSNAKTDPVKLSLDSCSQISSQRMLFKGAMLALNPEEKEKARKVWDCFEQFDNNLIPKKGLFVGHYSIIALSKVKEIMSHLEKFLSSFE